MELLINYIYFRSQNNDNITYNYIKKLVTTQIDIQKILLIF
jgi:hypothetical protein